MARHLRPFENISDLMGAEIEMRDFFPEEIEEEERIGGRRNSISVEEIPDENSGPLEILLNREEAYFLFLEERVLGKQIPEKYELFSRENENQGPFFLGKGEGPYEFVLEDAFPSSAGTRAERKAMNHKKRFNGKGRKR